MNNQQGKTDDVPEHSELWEAKPQNAPDQSIWKWLGTGLLRCILVVQCIVALAVTSDIIRGWHSPYVWEEVRNSLTRFGPSDAIFGAGLYLLFYLALAELAYVITKWLCGTAISRARNRAVSVLAAVWMLVTFFIFAPSAIVFARTIPIDVLNAG
jgi:hypothetical protein